ncbi:MAG: hypothetical protein ACP5DZ_10080 [Bacteroidales bacterium]
MKKTIQTTIMLMASVVVLFSCNSNPKQNDTNKDNEIIPNHELVQTDNLEITENKESDAQWDNISRQSITIEGYTLEKCMKLLVGASSPKVIVEGLENNPVMRIEYQPEDIWKSSVEENRQAVIEALKECYDFSIVDGTRELEIYTLTAYDSTKLKQSGDNVAGTSVKSVNETKTFSNYSFDRMMKAMEKEFDVIFRSDVENELRYNFESIFMGKQDRALDDVKEKYGMKFQKSTDMIDVKIVTFE